MEFGFTINSKMQDEEDVSSEVPKLQLATFTTEYLMPT